MGVRDAYKDDEHNLKTVYVHSLHGFFATAPAPGPCKASSHCLAVRRLKTVAFVQFPHHLPTNSLSLSRRGALSSTIQLPMYFKVNALMELHHHNFFQN